MELNKQKQHEALLREQVQKDLLAFLGGGANRREENVRAAEADGLPTDWIDDAWDEAEGTKEAEEFVREAREKAKAEAGSLFLPGAQPGVDPAPKSQPAPPAGKVVLIDGAPLIRRRQWWNEGRKREPDELKPEVVRKVGELVQLRVTQQAEAKPEPEFEEQPEAEQAKPGVLDPKAPLVNARKLVGLRYWRGDCRTLQFWQKQFWQWRGTHWSVLDEDTVKARIYQFLDQAEKETGRRHHRERFEPDDTAVNKTIHALRGEVNLEPENEMPGWLVGDCPVENVRELVAVQNGLLDVRTRRLVEHRPEFWSPNVLEFKYEAEAKAPRFEQFLAELWPGDEEAQQSLVEMIGLCITGETKYQKAWMFVGPKRGGRGTIGRVIRGLIGKENYVGTTMHSFGEPFGMQSFIGKKVAVFSDARLDGLRVAVLSLIAERLLNITGEDVMDINRKFYGYWSGMLKTRVAIFSNELLRFQDDTGALAGRFITNRMRESFWGREDPELTDKLLAERPGILNMALDGLDQLRARGSLIQPKSGMEMSENLTHLTSDILGFVEDCCQVDPQLTATATRLFDVWQDWCTERGIRHGWGLPQFSEKLRAACPTVRSSRPRVNNPSRAVTFYGIGIRGEQNAVGRRRRW